MDESEITITNILLKRGTNILEFSSDKEPIVLQSDPRPLNFMIKNLDFISPRGMSIHLGHSNSLRNLKKSGLFYSTYYKKQIPELKDIRMSPLEHYLLYGAWENKDPNPMFLSSFYLENNRDVYLSGMNPLLHYIQHGWREGRDPHPDFNTRRYLNAYPDVANTGMNPLLHYLKHGILEDRVLCTTISL